MADATRRVPFGEAMVPIVAAEHLLVRKAMLDRGKDWVGVEQMLDTAEDLDLAEVEAWLRCLAGDSDHRLKKLRQLVEAQPS